MEIIGYLKKQPSWKAYVANGKVRTGYDYECANRRWTDPKEIEIKEAEVPILQGELKLSNTRRGRSSVVFIWIDSEGYEYESATKASFEMFQRSVAGSVSGKFTLQKQGTQISIAPYEAP